MKTYWNTNSTLKSINEWQPNCWIQVTCPTEDDQQMLEDQFNIPDYFLSDISDTDERARYEYDDGWMLIILRIPYVKEVRSRTPYTTVPLGIIHKRDVTITVCYYETNMMIDFVSYQQKRGAGFTDHVDMIFRLFLSSAVWYLKRLKQINILIEKAKHNLDQDVNNELAAGTQIYIAEAGARLKGDIAQITEFLSPQIAIVGEIGAQHIEYFKTLENIRATKLEALGSKRLEKAFVHSSTQANEGEKIEIYDKDLSGVEASLDGVKFKLGEREFTSPLLGKFNAANLAVCVKTALYLGLDEARIASALARLKNVEHRLERIDAGGKIIIDDGFNGNFNGMSASYELVASYEGRKVLVTPGIMESSDEENEKLSKIINKTFDIVMLTSSLNAVALLKHLSRPKVIIIKDKSKMQEALAQNTKAGDLILFSNDAPSFM